jgi:hypothetical protein
MKLAEAEVLPATPATIPDPDAPIPKQIRYIIGNEGCERFSFYGMRNILTVFLVSSLLLYLPESERARGAKDVFHTFVIGVYFFPLLGGWLTGFSANTTSSSGSVWFTAWVRHASQCLSPTASVSMSDSA